jgi:hypothetical protein
VVLEVAGDGVEAAQVVVVSEALAVVAAVVVVPAEAGNSSFHIVIFFHFHFSCLSATFAPDFSLSLR